MDVTTALRFFEGHPVRLGEANTFTLDDTITAIAASCLKNSLDLTSNTEAARKFLTQIEIAYQYPENLPWIHESDQIIHSLEGLESEAVKATLVKIKEAQTIFKRRNPRLTEESPAFLKADGDFVIEAYKRDPNSLRWADIALRSNPDFMQKVYLIDFSGLEFASDDLKDNDTFMIRAVATNRRTFIFASERLMNSKQLILAACASNISLLQEAPDEFLDDEAFMLSAIRLDSRAIKYASIRLKDDDTFMLEAMTKYARELEFASDRLKDDEAFMKAAILKNSSAVRYASDRLKDNDTFMLAVMTKYSIELEFASDRLKDNEAFMKAAMLKDFSAIRHASDRLKDDHSFILMTMKLTHTSYISYASTRLKNDEAFMTAAALIDGMSVEYASDPLKDNGAFMLNVCIKDYSFLKHASKRLKDDNAFMLAVTRHDRRALEHASTRLRDNEAFMMQAISYSGSAFGYSSDRLLDNNVFVMMTLADLPFKLCFASPRLRNYPPCIVISKPASEIDEAFVELVSSYGFTSEDPVIKAILNYRNLDLKRYCMATFFLLMISCNHSKETWDEVIAPLFEKKQWAILPLMVMASMDLPKERGILPLPPSLDLKLLPHLFMSSINLAKGDDHFILLPSIDAFLKAHKESFKDARTGSLTTLLMLLKTLKKAYLGTSYLAHCLVIDNLEESLSRMKFLTLLVNRQGKAHIETLRDFSSSALLHDLLSEFIREGFIEEGSQEAFKRTFLASRHPEAIFSYASLFLEDAVMKPSLKSFIEMVIKGDFKAGRNEANSHKHRLTNDQKESWEAGAHLDGRYEPIIQEFNPKEFLVAKLITDDHAPDQFPHLKSHLTGSPVMGAATEVESLCFTLMEATALDEQLAFLRQLKEKLIGGGQFLRDIEDQIKLLEKREKARDVTLYDSANWQDLFYAGTEVLGSCQSVYASPGTNKCLLGYTLDGKTRILCAKNRGDEEGPMNARALIKILITEEGKPALFLERVYPPGNPAMDILIKNFALQRAHALGMDLYEAGEGTPLASEGCAAPFEYEDAIHSGAGSAVTNGKYTISAKKVS